MKTIKLPVAGITVNLTGDGGGSISSDLKGDDEDDSNFNIAMDAIESVILGHAIAGVDIESPAYLEGIETAIQACDNNL